MGERDRRSDEEIGGELAAARNQLAEALLDVRRAAGRWRERTAAAGRALVLGLMVAGLVKATRRLRARGQR